MRILIKILNITLVISIIIASLILIWGVAYSNYYVNQIDHAIKSNDYEFLLKNYDYYLEEPVFMDNNDKYNMHIYAVILYSRNEEGTVERNPGYSFYITNINTELIHLSTSVNDDKTKMVVSCNGYQTEYPILSHEYFTLHLVNFELNIDEIKEKCLSDILINLYDHDNHIFFSHEMNIKDYDLEFLESMGVRGYSTIEAFKQLFPANIIVTLIAVVIFYIILFIFVWLFFKNVVKKRKERRK